MGGGGDGGSKIGGGVELTDAILTCEGNISDPHLPSKLSHLTSCLQNITNSDEWMVRKVEHWNSVKVTFSIPKEAAERLYQLAQAGDTALHELGILSVQVEGDQIISLKINGPNNEPAEILLRADNNSNASNEMHASTSISRQPTHSFAVPSAVGGQAVLKTQPTQQFRSPVMEGGVVGISRPVMAHPRPVHQGLRVAEGAVSLPRSSSQQPVTQGISSAVAPPQRMVSVASRPTVPSNPPPPYPGQDTTREASNVHVANHSSLHKAGPSQVVASQPLTAHTQSNTSTYRASLGHTSQANNTVLQPGRNIVRAPMNMAKNSPLLVGLLQSPEQNSPILKSPKISTIPTRNTTRVSDSNPTSPSVSGVHSASNPLLPTSRSSREGTPTLQQICPVVSVSTSSISNSLPVMTSPKSSIVGSSNQTQMTAPKVQQASDIRLLGTDRIRYLPVAGSSQDRGLRGGLVNCIKKENIPSGSQVKIENQFLINPNTGLLEPRPSTDSSDSEADGKGLSPANNSAPSDDESSNGSKKEQDSSQTKMPSHQEKETASWHNSLISSGEKIKLKLKLGREPGAQTTIIDSKKVDKRRDNASIVNSLGTLGTAEPRVPKLHIKLHSSQPVIVKSLEESNKTGPLEDSKNTKFRKKLTRNKLRDDDFKFKCSKHKDGRSGDNIGARFLRLGENKRLRDGDHDSEAAKAPKLCDDSKITISKTSRLDKTRKPRKPVRKIGDLNSLGEITSHKIMETLPPAITKVADMHTQQPALSPTMSSMFSPTPLARDPLGFDVKLESKESTTTLSSAESKDHPLPAASNTFLSNGDVCVGSAINKVVLNPNEMSNTYRDTPEGLGSVKKFLKSSVLINKVGSCKPSYSNCVNSYRVVEDGTEKVFKKLDGFKNSEFPLLRTASDITIQSVSRSDLISLSKLESSQPKLESKIGRVLCVDVMDRKALEEALKSSRDSVKKVETSPKDPTTSMMDRLRRWNSIDNSSHVPFSSHQTSSDSTNLMSAAVKSEGNSFADGESEKNSTEMNCLRQSLTVASVNNKNDCDNSSAVNNLPVVDISQCPEALSRKSSSNSEEEKPDKKECLVEQKISDTVSKLDVPVDDSSISDSVVPACNASISAKADGKVTELMSAKVDVDSPEGTPKGDHGNGQGGEDSGIESMDALSEKSPNHNDQSPNRREEKECDIYSMKCKDSESTQQKEIETCAPTKESQIEETVDCRPSSAASCVTVKETSSAVVDTDVTLATDTPICIEQSTVNKKQEPSYQSTNDVPDTTIQSSTDHITTSVEKNDDCLSLNENINVDSCGKIKTNASIPPVMLVHNIITTSKEPVAPQHKKFYDDIKKPVINSIPVSLTKTTIANSSFITTTVANSSLVTTTITSSISTSTITSSSVTTTTISHSSIILQKFLTSSPGNTTTTSSQSNCGGTNSVVHNKLPARNISTTNPSLLAITLTRPAGSGKINSQYAASLAKNLDKEPADDLKLSTVTSLPVVENNSNVHSGHPTCNPVTTSSPTMIILATTTNSTSSNNSAPSNSKMVAVKPVAAASTSINPAIGKAFRLVALPGITSGLTPVSNPVRGQIVTLKPVMAVSGSTATITQSAILSAKPESQSTIVTAKLENQSVQSTANVDNISNHMPATVEIETDDLDFVGFSSAKRAEELKEKVIGDTGETCVPLMSPTEEEPTPMRVQPPLYTYGNKERKKESESDIDDKEKDPKAIVEAPVEDNPIQNEVPVNKLKENTLAALTIEIPPTECLPDDKRLTRATRQSARLSSPKVNSTSGDLSPLPDKKVAVVVGAGKPSVRSSVSPALRCTKRRHESESSNASSVSEDLQDSSSKNKRKKTSARDELLKGRATKFKEAAEGRDKGESSDDDGQQCDQVNSVNSTSQEDGLNNLKIGSAKDKEPIHLRDNVRRTSRQKSLPEKEESSESAEGKLANKSGSKVTTVLAKIKKENVEQQPDSEAGRRKTRSTAVTVTEDMPNKRRRQSKEK